MSAVSREKPKYTAAFVFALSGFFLLLLGYVWVEFLPERRPSVGGVLLATGLISAFLAVPLALLARKRVFSSSLATLKEEYVRYHSDPRVLEFDEQAWKVHWYEGEDIRPWTTLRAFHNWKTLFILSTETTSYWLPKDALEHQGQLEAVRELAVAALRCGEKLFSVPVCPSALVYTAASLFHNLRRAIGTRLLAYLLVALMIYWLGFSDPDLPKWGSLWLLLWVPVVLILFEALHILGTYYKSFRPKVSPQAEIMSDRIVYETEKTIWIGRYGRITEVREIPGAFLLYGNPQSFQLIPKKGFSAEQLRQFRELLVTNLGHLQEQISHTA